MNPLIVRALAGENRTGSTASFMQNYYIIQCQTAATSREFIIFQVKA